jgi:threonine/homoserine/homoserine lactone efflux protein
MISAFVFACIASFWGSVPPGPSNMAVLHTVLNKNAKTGIWMAMGACLPEIPYTFFAIVAVQYVNTFQTISSYFAIISAILLFSAGIFITFLQKSKPVDLDKSVRQEKLKISPFFKGAIIGSLNPMILGFWLVTAEVASKANWLDFQSSFSIVGFILGAATGALVLLILVAVFTHKIKQRLTDKVTIYLNKSIGITFILLGIIQAYKFYVS